MLLTSSFVVVAVVVGLVDAVIALVGDIITLWLVSSPLKPIGCPGLCQPGPETEKRQK